MNYSEFRQALPIEKEKNDPFWAKLVLRPLSLPVAWGLYRMGVSANMVSISGAILAIAAAILLGSDGFFLAVVGAILFNIIALGDCIDGNIARAAKSAGPGGDFMDALGGYTVYAFMPLALGFRAESLYALEGISGIWVLLGALMGVSNIYMRIVYQKYLNMRLSIMTQVEINAPSPKTSMVKRVSGELGFVGWMMPLLLIVVVVRWEHWYLLFYSVFYIMAASVITTKMVLRILAKDI